jgi:hypothetical protein
MIAQIICMGILGLSSLALGMFLLTVSFGAIRNSIRASKWPSVRGEIDRSSIDSKASPRAGKSGGIAVTYRLSVRYHYEVAGIVYKSSRFSFWEIGSSNAERVIGRLKLADDDRSVNVYYDPVNPASAVLDRSITGGVIALGAIGLFFVGGAMGTALVFSRWPRH